MIAFNSLEKEKADVEAEKNSLGFESARALAQKLGLKSRREWDVYMAGRRPDLPSYPGMPSNPERTYAGRGWRNFRDWLGVRRPFWMTPGFKWRSFEEARTWALRLKLTGVREWGAYCRGRRPDLPPKPEDIPEGPDRVYKDKGWVNWVDWLGLAPVFHRSPAQRRAFGRDREFVHALHLTSRQDWRAYCAGNRPDLPPKPSGIRTDPSSRAAYGGWWVSWTDWLGLPAVTTKNGIGWTTFDAARTFARSLKLKSAVDWHEYCAGKRQGLPPKPADIPVAANFVYARRGWAGWADWLGNTIVQCEDGAIWLPFKAARAFAQSLHFHCVDEWEEYIKKGIKFCPGKPEDVPAAPARVYAEWRGWDDWLGCPEEVRMTAIGFRPFAQARDFVRSLDLSSRRQWRLYATGHTLGHAPRPKDIPLWPEKAYKEWSGFADWIGRKNTCREWLPFDDARAFVRSLGLRTVAEWHSYVRGERADLPQRRADIPAAPQTSYREWVNWPDWLGTVNHRAQKSRWTRWMPFSEARDFARDAHLTSAEAWKLYCAHGFEGLPEVPVNIPSNPQIVYAAEGWVNWADWLGKTTRNARCTGAAEAPPAIAAAV